jgi:hypothetical protein
MRKLFLFLFVSFLTTVTKAQDTEVEPRPYTDKDFCILVCTKNYAEAKKAAQQAAKKTGLTLDLRDLIPNKKIGLTTPKANVPEGEEYPQYYSRGRYDDGEYISIEYSNAFTGFAKGLYMVIAYSGEKDEAKATLKKVKPFYKTAYIKRSEVYIGCMH